MLFRRDLARSGSALACNILAGRPKGTHVAVVPRRANARQPPPPPARPKRAGRGSLGRAWDRGALAFACMRPHTHCMLPHARTAHPHRTRHSSADVMHDMAQAAPHCGRAHLPRPSMPPKPGASRLSPDSPLLPSYVAAVLTVQVGRGGTGRRGHARRGGAARGSWRSPAAEPRPAAALRRPPGSRAALAHG